MMRVRQVSSTLPLLATALAAAFAAGSCQGDRSVSPSAPSAVTAGGDGRVSAQSVGSPPTAVFKTQPPANGESVITGGSTLDVTFNLCQSTDPDAGDELKYTFDYDGDGTVDEKGHCRTT